MNGGFTRRITYKWSIFQKAMFEYRMVIIINPFISIFDIERLDSSDFGFPTPSSRRPHSCGPSECVFLRHWERWSYYIVFQSHSITYYPIHKVRDVSRRFKDVGSVLIVFVNPNFEAQYPHVPWLSTPLWLGVVFLQMGVPKRPTFMRTFKPWDGARFKTFWFMVCPQLSSMIFRISVSENGPTVPMAIFIGKHRSRKNGRMDEHHSFQWWIFGLCWMFSPDALVCFIFHNKFLKFFSNP